MEDHPRPDPGEDDPLDLFDSEGESAFAERDFEPLTDSTAYETTPHGRYEAANAMRHSAPQELHPSLAQGRAAASASPWMVITGAAAVVIVLLAVPLLFSRGSDDRSDLSSPSVEVDRSPASTVSRGPETAPPVPGENSARSEDSSSPNARDTDRASAAAQERATQEAARRLAARDVTTPEVDQRPRDAASVASARIPSVTPAPIRTETPPPLVTSSSPSSTPPPTSPSSSAATTSSAPAPQPDTSSSSPVNPTPAAPQPSPSSAPAASTTLASAPAPAAVNDRPVLSSELARAAPPTAAPASAVVPRETLVQSALYKYRDALNSRDFSSARAVYPSINVGAISAALQKTPQTMNFDKCNVDFKGPTANVSCPGTVRFTPTVGNTKERTQPRRFEFKLIEKNGAWVIDQAQ